MKKLNKTILALAMGLGVLTTALTGLAETASVNGRTLTFSGPTSGNYSPVGSGNTQYRLRFTDTKNPGSFTIASGDIARVRILAVGGGGAGGSVTSNNAGGGGGAGGCCEITNYLYAGTYTVMVGAGGAKPTSDKAAPGLPGGQSYIKNSAGEYVCVGQYGGGGGTSIDANKDGTDGGSGGGGTWYNKVAGVGGSYVAGQGFAGGTPTIAGIGAGGGGAGGEGGADGTAGAGRASDIFNPGGSPTVYAAGGAGGNREATADAADGVGYGAGGAGGNQGKGGKGGDGVVIVLIESLKAITSIGYPAYTAGFALTPNGTKTAFDAATAKDRSGNDISAAIQKVEGTTSVYAGVSGTTTNGLGHYQFTVYLNPGYVWSESGTANPYLCNWRVTTDLNKTDSTVDVNKQVVWDKSNESNAVISVASYATPEMNPKYPKVLFVGGLCTVHTLNADKLKKALNAAAENADVDYWLCNDHKTYPSYADIKGSIEHGKTFDKSVTLRSSNHVILPNMWEAILDRLDPKSSNYKKYDYVIFEFDGNRIINNLEPQNDVLKNQVGAYYGVTINDSNRSDYFIKYVTKVAEVMQPYYDGNKIMWVVDQKTSAEIKAGGDPFSAYYYCPSTYYWIDSANYANKEYKFIFLSSCLYPKGILNPTSCPQSSTTGSGHELKNMRFGYERYSNSPKAWGGAKWEKQKTYETSEGLAEYIRSEIKAIAYNLKFEDKIEESTGLSIDKVEATICDSNAKGYATEDDVTKANAWVNLLTWDGATGKTTYNTAKQAIIDKLKFKVVDNTVTLVLTNLTVETWTRMQIYVSDPTGDFRTSDGAVWNPETQQWEKNPNDGKATVKMVEPDGSETTVKGEASTAVNWVFTAYDVTANADYGDVYMNGMANTNQMSFVGGYSPNIQYVAYPGYRLDAITADGKAVAITTGPTGNENSYTFSKIDRNHDLVLNYIRIAGTTAATATNVVYDGKAHLFSVALSGFDATYELEVRYCKDSGGTYQAASDFIASRTSAGDDNVGTYRYYYKVYAKQPKFDDDGHMTYEWVPITDAESSTVTITKKDLFVMADSEYYETASQDDWVWKKGVTYSGLVSGDTFYNVFNGTGTVDLSTMGQYEIVLGYAGGKSAYDVTKSNNYNVYLQNGAVNVIKGPIKIGGVKQFPWLHPLPVGFDTGVPIVIKEYDGTSAGLTVNVTDPTSNTTTTWSKDDGKTWTSTKPTYLHAGTNKVWYAVTPKPGTYQDEHYFAATNYQFVIITPRKVTVTSGSATQKYNGTALTKKTVEVVSGSLVSGDSITSVNCPKSQKDVGSTANDNYTFGVTGTAGSYYSDYDFTKLNGTLTVQPQTMIFKDGSGKSVEQSDDPDWPKDPADDGVDDVVCVYDGYGTNLAINVTRPSSGAKILYSLDKVTWSENLKLYDACDKTRMYFAVEQAGYVAVTNYAHVTIKKRAITVTANPRHCFLGDPKPTPLTATVRTPADRDAANIQKVIGYELDCPTFDGKTPGKYPIVFTKAPTETTNYTVTYYNDNVYITVDPITFIGGIEQPTDPTKPLDPETVDTGVPKVVKYYDGVPEGIAVNVTIPYPLPAGSTIMYATSKDGPWRTDNYLYTDVSTHKVWYAVTIPETPEGYNYPAVTNYQYIVINPRPVKLTSATDSWVYDAKAHSNTAVIATSVSSPAFPAGEGVTTNGFTTITNVGTNDNVFGYALTASTKPTNYTISCATGTIAVTAREIGDDCVFNFDSTDFTYNAQGQGPTVTSIVVDGITFAVDGFEFAGNFETNAYDKYYVTITKTSPNFKIKKGCNPKAQWEIKKAVLNVKADDRTLTYGDPAPALDTYTWVATGYVGGEDASVIDATNVKFESPYKTTTDAGTYPTAIGVSGLKSGNYSFSYTKGALIVKRRGIDVPVGAENLVYNGAEQTGLASAVEYTVTAGGTGTDAGPYTATVEPTGNYCWTDGTDDPKSVPWTILKRPLILQSKSKDKPYDGDPLKVEDADITPSGQGYAPGECFDYTDKASITDVGKTEATFAWRESATAKLSNYDVSYGEKAYLEVTPALDEISVVAASEKFAYDGKAHSNNTWTVRHRELLKGDDYADATVDASCVVTTPADGIVTNRFSMTGVYRPVGGAVTNVTANYNFTNYVGYLEVTNGVIDNVFLTPHEGPYDGQPYGITVTTNKLTNGRYPEIEYGLTPTGPWQKEPFTFTDVTNVTVYVVAKPPAGEPWYDAYTNSTTVTITPRAITLKSADEMMAYSKGPASTVVSKIKVTSGSFVEGEAFDYTSTGSQKDIGSSPASFTYAPGNAQTKLSNYAVTTDFGTLTIVANDAIGVTAASETWAFDNSWKSNHTYTATGTNDLQAGYSLRVTFSDESKVFWPGEVTNAITKVEVLDDKGQPDGNYTNFTFVSGLLTVVPAKLPDGIAGVSTNGVYDATGYVIGVEIPEDDILTRPITTLYSLYPNGPFGPVNPALTNAGARVTYFTVTAPGYETVTNSALVTVTPRKVTLLSGSDSKVYDGDPLKKETVDYAEGSLKFVGTDGYTPANFASQTDAGSSDNLFTYELTSGTIAENYSIEKKYGKLTVDPADFKDFTIAGVEKTYDGLGSSITLTVDTTKYPSAKLSYATVTGIETAYGAANPSYTNAETYVTYAKIKVDNYKPVYTNALVKITAREAAITFTADDKTYDGTTTATHATTNFANVVAGEGFTLDVTKLSFAFDTKNVGEDKTVKATGYTDDLVTPLAGTLKANYTFDFTNTTKAAITKAPLTIRPDDREVVYGEAIVTNELTWTGTGYVAGEGPEVVTGTPVWTSSYEIGHTAGTLDDIQVSGLDATNYAITYVPGTLTVKKAVLDLPVGAQNLIYNGKGQVGLSDGKGYTVVSGGVQTNANDKYVAVVRIDSNYTWWDGTQSDKNVDWVIKKRELTLSSTTKDKDYDGTPLAVESDEIKPSGMYYAEGECFDYGDFGSITDLGSKDATFSYFDSATAKSSNYIVTREYGTLTINPAPDQIVVTPPSATWAYDGEKHSTNGWTAVNQSKVAKNDYIKCVVDTNNCYVMTPDDGIVTNRFLEAGIYRMVGGVETNVTANYNFTNSVGLLTVTNATISIINLDKLSTNGVYNATEYMIGTPEVETKGGQSHEIAYARSEEGPYGSDKPGYTDVKGTGEEEPSTTWFVVTAPYHTPVTNSATVRITRRPIAFTSGSQTGTYPCTLTTAVGEDDITVGGDGYAGSEKATFAADATISEIGHTNAAFKVSFTAPAQENNYKVTKNFGTLTVARPNAIVLVADDGNWTYDGSDHTQPTFKAYTNGVLVVDNLIESDKRIEAEFSPLSVVKLPTVNPVENTIVTARVYAVAGHVEIPAYDNWQFQSGKLTVDEAEIEGFGVISTNAVYDGTSYAVTVIPPTKPADAKIGFSTQPNGPFNATPLSYKDANEYTVYAQASATGYRPYVTNATVTITKRPVTLESGSATKKYDTTPLTCNEVTVKGGEGYLDFVLGEGLGSFVCTGSRTEKGETGNTFDYTFTANTKADNYNISKINGTLTVTAGDMPLAAKDWEGPYDGGPHSVGFEGTTPPGVEKYFTTTPDVKTSYVKDANPAYTNVGTYAVSVKIAAPNYATSYQTVYVKILKRSLWLTPPNKSKDYDGTALTFDGTEIIPGDRGYAPGEKFDYYGYSAQTNVGKTASTFSYKENATTKLANYTVTIIGDKFLTVNPCSTQIVATAASATWTFDGEKHFTNDWTVANASLFEKYGDEFLGEINTNDCQIVYPDESPVSNVFKTAKIVRWNDARTAYEDRTDAYNFTTMPGELKISKATIVLTDDDLDYNEIYDGANHSIKTPSVEVQGGAAVRDSVKIVYSKTQNGGYGDNKPEWKDVDEEEPTHVVWFVVTADYHEALTNSAKVTIRKRSVVFTAPDDSKTYNGTPLVASPALTAEGDGFVTGEGATPSDCASITDPGNTKATFAVTTWNAGTLASNYSVTKNFGLLTVYHPGVIGIESASETWEFDGQTHTTNGYRIASGTVAASDTLTVVMDDAAKIMYPDESPVANLVKTVTVDRAGTDVTSNYTFTITSGKLNVTPIDFGGLVLTGVTTNYDGLGHSITGAVTGAVIGGEPTYSYATSEGGPWSTENPSYTNAGTYAVWCKITKRGYNEKKDKATVTIMPREITLKSGSETKVYDGIALTNEELKVVSGTFVAGEGIASNRATSSQLDVGTTDNTYEYFLKDNTRELNYSITTLSGTLEVTPIEIDIPKQPESYIYNGKAQQGIFDGAGYYVKSGAIGTNVDDYVAIVALSNNYAWVGGSTADAEAPWKIYRRSLTLTPPSKEREFNNQPLTFAGTEIVPGGNGYAAGECFFYTNFSSRTAIGRTPSTFDYSDSGVTKKSNYDVTVIGDKFLTVTPCSTQIVATAVSATWTYDGTAHFTNAWTIANANLFESYGDEFRGAIDTNACRIVEPGVSNTWFMTAEIGHYIEPGHAWTNRTAFYSLTTVTGLLTVVNAQLEVTNAAALPYDGLYDGAEHSIGVPGIKSMGDQPVTIVYSKTKDAGYASEMPKWKNVEGDEDSHTVWFVATAPFHDALTNSATVTIRRRTLNYATSDLSKTYDGEPLVAEPCYVGGDGLVKGESAATNNFASITKPGSKDATFDVSFLAGARANNYIVNKTAGTLTVYDQNTVGIEAASATWAFDGYYHSTNGFTAVGKKVNSNDVYVVEFEDTSKIKYPDETPVANLIKTVHVWRVESPASSNEVTASYVFNLTPGKLSVTPIDFEGLTATGVTTNYNGESYTITPSVSVMPIGGEPTYEYSESAEGPWSATPLYYKNAGEHKVYCKASKRGYNDKVVSATVLVNARPVTLLSGSATKVYDGTPLVNEELKVVSGSFVAGEGVATNWATSEQTDVGSTDNTFQYVLNGNTLADNYKITPAFGTLTVTPKEIDVPHNPMSFVYNGSAQTGIVDGPGYYVVDGNVATNVGPYQATVALSNNYAWVGGSTAPAKANWSIRKRRVSLTPPSKDKEYDSYPLSFTGVEITPGDEGYAPGECFEYSGFLSRTEIGKTPSTFRYADSATAKASNYEVTVVGEKFLEVKPNKEQIVATPVSATWTYDGTAHFTNAWTIVNAEKFEGYGDRFRGEIATNECRITLPGVVSNRFAFAEIGHGPDAAWTNTTANYSFSTLTGVLEVVNADLVLTNAAALPYDKIYDGASHTIGKPLFRSAGGREVTVRYATSANGPFTAAEPAEWKDVEGEENSHTVWFVATADYHNAVTNSATVTIRRRALVFDAPDASKAYDHKALLASPALAPEGDGFVSGEGCTFVNLASITEPGSKSATYDVKLDANTASRNYKVTKTWGTLTVYGTEVVAIEAASGTWDFDNTAHSTNGYTVVGEKMNSNDVFTVVFDPDSEVTYPEEGAVANNITTVTVARVEGTAPYADVTTNYTFVLKPGALRVTAVDLPELVVTGVEKTYDGKGASVSAALAAQPLTTASFAYAASKDGPWGENPSYTNAGTHVVWVKASAKGYNDRFASADVKINARPVTLLSGSATKVYDGTPLVNEELKVVSGSFVAGEGVESQSFYNEQVEVGSTDNTFQYVLNGNTLADNYKITPAFGRLEVTAAPIEGHVVEGVDRVYDGRKHAISVTVPEKYAATVAYSSAGYAETSFGPTNPEYAEVCTRTTYVRITARNYQTVYTNAIVRITPATLTVKADDKTVYYGDPVPEYTYTVTGFVNSELEKDVVSGAPVLTGLYEPYVTAIGTHPDYILCEKGTLAATNYVFDCKSGSVTVERGEIRHTVDVPVVPYDGHGTNITLTVVPPPAGVVFKPKFRTPEGEWLEDFPPVYTNAGSYTIVYVIEDGDEFEPVTNTVTMVITPRKITLKSPNKDKMYDGDPLELLPEEIGAGGMGFADGERFSFPTRASRTDVGTCKAAFTYADGTAKLANYEIQRVEYGTLWVKPNLEQILVRSASGTWTYDGTAHGTNGYEVVGESNVKEGDWIEVVLAGTTVTYPTEDVVTNGIASVKIYRGPKGVVSSSTDVTAEYGDKLKKEEGFLSVANAKFSEPDVTPYRGYYDGADHGIVVTAPPLCGGGFADVVYPDGNAWRDATNVTVRYELRAQYYDTFYGQSTVDILPRTIRVTSADETKKHDGTPLKTAKSRIALSSPLVGDETVDYENLGERTDVGRGDATFNIRFLTAKPCNYAFESVPGSLVVYDQERISVIATNVTRVYDAQAYSNHAFTVTDPKGVLPAGATVKAIFDPASVITDPGTAENRILAARIFSADGEDITSDFDDPVLIPGQLRVINAVFADVTAHSTNVVYDGTGYSISVETPDALGGDVTVTYSTVGEGGPFQAENPKFVAARDEPYRVFFKVSAKGYDDYVGSAHVKIGRRPVTVRSAPAEKVYDATALSRGDVRVADETPLAAGDALVAKTTASQTGAGSTENTFDYQVADAATGTEERTKNYDVKLEYAVLTVRPYGLVVRYEADDKVYDGETNATWSGVHTFTPADGMKPMPAGQGFKLEDKGAVDFWFDDPNVGDRTVTAVRFALANVSGTNAVSKTGNYSFEFVETTSAKIIKQAPPPLDPDDPSDPKLPPKEEVGPFDEGPNRNPPAPRDDGGNVRTLSNYDVVTVYDGRAHTYDYASLTNSIATNEWISAGYGIVYSLDGKSWTEQGEQPFSFTNVVSTSFWYKVTAPFAAPNYSNYIHAVGVTILPRPITVKASFQRMTYDDPETLDPGFGTKAAWSVRTDGVPTMDLSRGDTLEFVDLTFDRDYREYECDKTNYNAIVTNKAPAGAVYVISNGVIRADVTSNYAILFEPGDLYVDENLPLFSATFEWATSGDNYLAHLVIVNTNKTDTFKYKEGSMRFLFADRTGTGSYKGGIYLWDAVKKVKRPEETFDGQTYRACYLESPTTPWKHGVSNEFGPKKTDSAIVRLKAAAHTPVVHVEARLAPSAGNEEAFGLPYDEKGRSPFLAWLVWEAQDGTVCSIPLLAHKTLEAAQAAAPTGALGATYVGGPVSTSAMNKSAAYGVACASGIDPVCEITEFAIGETEISGRVEMRAGAQTGVPTAKAEVWMVGADDLDGDFTPLARVVPASDGSFKMTRPANVRFFKMRVDVAEETFK